MSYAGMASSSASLVSALGVKVAMQNSRCIERNIEFHRVSFGVNKAEPKLFLLLAFVYLGSTEEKGPLQKQPQTVLSFGYLFHVFGNYI